MFLTSMEPRLAQNIETIRKAEKQLVEAEEAQKRAAAEKLTASGGYGTEGYHRSMETREITLHGGQTVKVKTGVIGDTKAQGDFPPDPERDWEDEEGTMGNAPGKSSSLDIGAGNSRTNDIIGDDLNDEAEKGARTGVQISEHQQASGDEDDTLIV